MAGATNVVTAERIWRDAIRWTSLELSAAPSRIYAYRQLATTRNSINSECYRFTGPPACANEFESHLFVDRTRLSLQHEQWRIL